VAFIDEYRDEFGVEPICDTLQVAPSTYYAVKARVPSVRALRDQVMIPILLGLWTANRKVYGAHKLWKAARRTGHDIGRDQVARLMRQVGIQGVSRQRRVRTTRPDPAADRHPDLVCRQFTADAPNRLWTVDLTYVATWQGVAYVCFITDAFSRRLVGWRVAAHMRASMVLDALEMARWSRGTRLEGLVAHSDAGSQGEISWWLQHLRWWRWRCSSISRWRRSGRCAARCGRRVDRRRSGVSTGSGSGRRSPGGCRPEEAATEVGMSPAVGARWFREAGGMPSLELVPVSGHYLSFAEREEIAILHDRDVGVREIARRLGRAPSTISRELRRNASTRSNELTYRASTAQWHAERRASRPKVAKLAGNDRLREYVQDRLAGEIARPDGEPVPGPDVRFVGRRHGRRADRRWAKSWSPSGCGRSGAVLHWRRPSPGTVRKWATWYGGGRSPASGICSRTLTSPTTDRRATTPSPRLFPTESGKSRVGRSSPPKTDSMGSNATCSQCDRLGSPHPLSPLACSSQAL